MAKSKARVHIGSFRFGVGTIAAGVAKCHADVVPDLKLRGGTGAAPLNAIKRRHPWRSACQNQQTLVLNGLRSASPCNVTAASSDPGRDGVVIAAPARAEEFGFAHRRADRQRLRHDARLQRTPARRHRNQDRTARARFKGKPERISSTSSYFIAESTGCSPSSASRTLGEAVSHVECLDQGKRSSVGSLTASA